MKLSKETIDAITFIQKKKNYYDAADVDKVLNEIADALEKERIDLKTTENHCQQTENPLIKNELSIFTGKLSGLL